MVSNLSQKFQDVKQFDQKQLYKVNRKYEILIIQNISSTTKNFIDFNNSLGLLPFEIENNYFYSLNSQQNNFAKKKFQNGGMNRTIAFSKFLGFVVDHYYLSLDYGLISENTPVPNYDCLERKIPSDLIQKRVKRLGIAKSIAKLPQYNLIYIAVTQEQLKFLDLSILQTKGKEIVFFTPNLYIAPPFLGFNVRDLKNVISNRNFLPVPIQNNFKANLLLNYLIMKIFFQQTTFLNFIQALLNYSVFN